MVNATPFLLETKGVELGGKYKKADAFFGGKIDVDGNLYTGQNQPPPSLSKKPS